MKNARRDLSLQPAPFPAVRRAAYSAWSFGYLVGSFLRKLTRVQALQFRSGLIEGYGNE